MIYLGKNGDVITKDGMVLDCPKCPCIGEEDCTCECECGQSLIHRVNTWGVGGRLFDTDGDYNICNWNGTELKLVSTGMYYPTWYDPEDLNPDYHTFSESDYWDVVYDRVESEWDEGAYRSWLQDENREEDEYTREDYKQYKAQQIHGMRGISGYEEIGEAWEQYQNSEKKYNHYYTTAEAREMGYTMRGTGFSAGSIFRNEEEGITLYLGVSLGCKGENMYLSPGDCTYDKDLSWDDRLTGQEVFFNKFSMTITTRDGTREKSFSNITEQPVPLTGANAANVVKGVPFPWPLADIDMEGDVGEDVDEDFRKNIDERFDEISDPDWGRITGWIGKCKIFLWGYFWGVWSRGDVSGSGQCEWDEEYCFPVRCVGDCCGDRETNGVMTEDEINALAGNGGNGTEPVTDNPNPDNPNPDNPNPDNPDPDNPNPDNPDEPGGGGGGGTGGGEFPPVDDPGDTGGGTGGGGGNEPPTGDPPDVDDPGDGGGGGGGNNEPPTTGDPPDVDDPGNDEPPTIGDPPEVDDPEPPNPPEPPSPPPPSSSNPPPSIYIPPSSSSSKPNCPPLISVRLSELGSWLTSTSTRIYRIGNYYFSGDTGQCEYDYQFMVDYVDDGIDVEFEYRDSLNQRRYMYFSGITNSGGQGNTCGIIAPDHVGRFIRLRVYVNDFSGNSYGMTGVQISRLIKRYGANAYDADSIRLSGMTTARWVPDYEGPWSIEQRVASGMI